MADEQSRVDEIRNRVSVTAWLQKIEENDSTNDDELLVLHVRDMPILWNTARKDYQNKTKTEACWQEIGRNLKREASECSARWENLCERHELELKNQQKLRGPEKDLEEKWELAKVMSFLCHCSTPVQSTSMYWGVSDKDSLPGSPETEDSMFLEAPSSPSFQQESDDASTEFSYSSGTSTSGEPPNKRRLCWDQSYLTTRVSEELINSMKLMQTLADTMTKRMQQTSAKSSRLDGLFKLIAGRYNALSSDLKDEFDSSVLQFLDELERRQRQ